jgi:hypothetical protein
MTDRADPLTARPQGCGHTAAEHQDHVRNLFAVRDPLGALMKRNAIRIGLVDEDDLAAEPGRFPAAAARRDHTCRVVAAAAPAIPA